jgi:hypothetical protein
MSELEGLVLSTFLMYAGVMRPEYFSQLMEHLEGSNMKLYVNQATFNTY